jgi:hypothetical protein
MTPRHLQAAFRLLAGGALAVFLAIAACDRGTGPDDHDHTGDGEFCGHVDNVGGCMLVSHGDTLCVHDPDGVAGKIEVLAGGLKHAIHVSFLDEHLEGFSIANDCAIMALAVTSDDPDVAEIQPHEAGLRWYFNVYGKRAGQTALRVGLVHDSHAHYTSDPIPVEVLPPPLP